MDQSSQVSYSDTHLDDKDSSHLQANDEMHSRVDERGGRVQPTVDVAEIIRRWTHALQRIHKQSLLLVFYLLFWSEAFLDGQYLEFDSIRMSSQGLLSSAC